jgi:catechol 2,3-dioxygenase-like lactoylglutathione lyase family enzyme
VSTPVLIGLDVAGAADAWREAGFAVDADGVCRLGQVRMQTGVGEQGISGWTLGDAPMVEAAEHPNGAYVLDHLVVFTDDPDRTTHAYADLGLEVRRVREIGNGRTQTFFRAGEVIIELVGPIDEPGDRADEQAAGRSRGSHVTERFFGLSPAVSDLDACAELLGDRLGPIKDATQPGRRIATLRHEACGLTIPIAFMSAERR